ncbi:MAG: (d)CMP kinase [Gammaproteobacteria bacterium]
MSPSPVVTVDGPSGVGKGTLCAFLSRTLGWHLLDSGAIYRLLGLAAKRRDVDSSDIAGLTRLAEGLDIAFLTPEDGSATRALLNNEDVTADIRTEEAGAMASLVAPHSEVRAALLERQRNFRRAPGLVADGRDMGTVVFQDAPVKLFLTASAEERAARRYKQLIQQGVSANLAALSVDIAERDRRDTARVNAPLRPAADAVTIDTTGVSISEVARVALSTVQSRLR